MYSIKNEKLSNILYTPTLEDLLSTKGEECDILSKLHLMSHKKYKNQETYYNIPIITISAFIGFISAVNINFEYVHLILGGLSLFVSLLKSYFSYLKISQKSENHRVTYIQYNQISNEIRIELALEPSMRQPVTFLLNLIKIKMKNLNEVSDIIDNDIIDKFINERKELADYATIGKPDILYLISPIKRFSFKPTNFNEENEEVENEENQENKENEEIEEIRGTCV
jgi:hypothetical protein